MKLISYLKLRMELKHIQFTDLQKFTQNRSR